VSRHVWVEEGLTGKGQVQTEGFRQADKITRPYKTEQNKLNTDTDEPGDTDEGD